ncbi:MAG TPA: hypothetical protein VIP57_16305 [Candidatus Dormibacteraeota bacterium]
MDQLPPNFAEMLATVLEPGHENRIAEIIGAATRLDDDALRMFLDSFAARVRESPAPIKPEELMSWLRASETGGQSSAT